jgi:predicted porin
MMQRKLHAAIAILGIGLTGAAFAQGDVTLYGIVDQSVRFTNNSNAANDNQV